MCFLGHCVVLWYLYIWRCTSEWSEFCSDAAAMSVNNVCVCVCVCVCVSVCLCVAWWNSVAVHQSYQSWHCTSRWSCWSGLVSYLSHALPALPPLALSSWWCSLSVCLSFCLSVSLTVCLSVILSVCPFVCISVSLWQFVYLDYCNSVAAICFYAFTSSATVGDNVSVEVICSVQLSCLHSFLPCVLWSVSMLMTPRVHLQDC